MTPVRKAADMCSILNCDFEQTARRGFSSGNDGSVSLEVGNKASLSACCEVSYGLSTSSLASSALDLPNMVLGQ
jgi:hypothetical protein